MTRMIADEFAAGLTDARMLVEGYAYQRETPPRPPLLDPRRAGLGRIDDREPPSRVPR
jgi:hypothetical protein